MKKKNNKPSKPHLSTDLSDEPKMEVKEYQ